LFRGFLERYNRGKIVITGFREPLSRTISAYFENISNPEMPIWYFGSAEEVYNAEIEILIERFQDSLPEYIRLELNSWLMNYCHVIGFKLQEIPRQKKFTLLERNMNKFWIYKLEYFENFEQEFFRTMRLGTLSSFSQKENLGREKWYSSIYKKFLTKFKISEKDYKAYFLSCDWVSHFHTDAELLRFAKTLLK
jgi:hypothetical protein